MTEQLYCTLDELIVDLALHGSKAFESDALLGRIEAASNWIAREFGAFIPIVGQKFVDGSGGEDLFIPALLAMTACAVDGVSVSLSDLHLYPQGRYWDHGPYTRIRANPNGNAAAVWSIGRQNVAITGRWGLYEKTETCQVVGSQTVDAETLSVSNGARLAPGMVLMLDDEQEVVKGVDTPCDSTADLAANCDAAQEVIQLSDGSQVQRGEIVRLDFEQMRIQDLAGNQALVARGWNGTSKSSHVSGTSVQVYRSFIVKRAANGTTAAAHTTATIYRFVPPADVNWLCRQIAGLMHKKAATGFAGRSGNAETGETTYYNEFPRQIQDIRRHYGVIN